MSTQQLDSDARTLTERLAKSKSDLAALPPKADRSPAQQEKADAIVSAATDLREEFMATHARAVYERLTDGYTKQLRVGDLTYAAAAAFPHLTPTRDEIAAERELLQKHKDGLELDQGVFLAAIFDDEYAGFHLMHSMTQPTPESKELLDQFRKDDRIDLGTCYLVRDGEIGYLTINNQKYLNAEDDEYIYALEIATDLVLLDDRIKVGVLRGERSTHKKYYGRRVFCSGVNLTKLYHGQQPFIGFFVEREVGLLNKWYRGHDLADGRPSTVERRHEKPWVAAVESHAIGGGCQYLLVMDAVVAQSGSYVNLPARREGFIPGAGNLRLPRFVGERATRQGIFYDKAIYVDSPLGQQVVDRVVGSEQEMDVALREVALESIGTGPVGVTANRTQMRVGVEPIQVLQRYMANLALWQARCMVSPAIISNLEVAWDPKVRGGLK